MNDSLHKGKIPFAASKCFSPTFRQNPWVEFTWWMPLSCQWSFAKSTVLKVCCAKAYFCHRCRCLTHCSVKSENAIKKHFSASKPFKGVVHF